MRFLAIHINREKKHLLMGMTQSQRLFTVLLVLYPILNIYQSGININIGFADALMLAFMVIHAPYVLKKKLVITDYMIFVVYLTFVSFIDTIASVNGGVISAMNLISVVRHSFYGVIICIYVPLFFNLQYGTYLMKLWSLIVSAGVMLQCVLYYVFHRIQFFWLPVESFTGGESKAIRYASMERFALRGLFRPSFVFIEPAHFTQYAIVGVLLFLFCEKRKARSSMGALFCSLAIILSTSTGGIVAMALAWVVWLLQTLQKIVTRKRIERYIFSTILCLMIAVMGALIITGAGEMVTGRIEGIGSETATSGNLRVRRGFLIFLKLDPWRKIFGVGIGNIEDYFMLMNMKMPFVDGDYMNGLTYVLNSGGIIGAVLLLVVLFRRMFRRGYFLMALSLVVLTLSLGASNFNSDPWKIYMAFLLYTKKDFLNTVEVKNGQH